MNEKTNLIKDGARVKFLGGKVGIVAAIISDPSQHYAVVETETERVWKVFPHDILAVWEPPRIVISARDENHQELTYISIDRHLYETKPNVLAKAIHRLFDAIVSLDKMHKVVGFDGNYTIGEWKEATKA